MKEKWLTKKTSTPLGYCVNEGLKKRITVNIESKLLKITVTSVHDVVHHFRSKENKTNCSQSTQDISIDVKISYVVYIFGSKKGKIRPRIKRSRQFKLICTIFSCIFHHYEKEINPFIDCTVRFDEARRFLFHSNRNRQAVRLCRTNHISQLLFGLWHCLHNIQMRFWLNDEHSKRRGNASIEIVRV